MSIIPKVAIYLLKPLFWIRNWLAAITTRSGTFNRIVSKTLFEDDSVVVLPMDQASKSRIVDVNIPIDDPSDTTMVPSDVAKELIRRSKNIFIMNFCLCRRSNGCKDYPKNSGCVFLGKGVHKIPKTFGHLATADEAMAYIDDCASQGLTHIIGRNKLDRLWLGVEGKRDLINICNCCPCCCLWTMARNISDEIGSSIKRMDGVDISLDGEKCIGCGSCIDACFTKAVSIADGKAVIDQKHCRCCGRCVIECPTDAITLTYDESRINAVIDGISSIVDLT